jgi:glycosyltransferase involved in cell wall biosynthesis
MLSKALVAGPYQRKAELIAAEPDIELTVAVPPFWRDGDRPQPLERMHTEGYRLLETPVRLPGNFHLHHYPAFSRLLDELRPDVVHVDEEPYNLATFLALRATHRRRIPALFFTWQNLPRRYPPPFRQFESFVHRHTAAAIAGSQTAADVLRRKGYKGPLSVIPQFGVDPEVFAPAAGPRPKRPLAVGYAGRLVAGKGVDLLLTALARVPEPWTLTLVGDGPEREQLVARAAALGLTDRVTFHSWLPAGDVPGFFLQLDAFVLPSRSTPTWIEQFGRVLIEAMASGVPCVGSDSGEIPHVLGEAGLVFPEDDAAALAGHLTRLATEPGLRASLAAAGRARVMERFTMARVAGETVGVYRAIAA